MKRQVTNEQEETSTQDQQIKNTLNNDIDSNQGNNLQKHITNSLSFKKRCKNIIVKPYVFIAIAAVIIIVIMSFFVFYLSTTNNTTHTETRTVNLETTTDTVEVKKEPVYVILESHNEDVWGPKVNLPNQYKAYRENLVERLDLIASYGAALDWQSDHTVLEAMIKYETQDDLLAKTDGVNILQYMKNLGFSVDPHVHTYNHADVVQLIEELGVKAGAVIGGVEVFGCGDPLYTFSDWQNILGLESDGSIHGVIYPDAVWTPKILSGAAFPGHWYGDFTSGVWRPGSTDTFYTNQPNGSIVNIGSGYPYDELNIGWEHAGGSLVSSNNAAYLKELIAKIQSGEAPSGQMYTAAFQIRDESTLTDGDEVIDVNQNLGVLLEQLKPYVDNGQIIYVTYEEALHIWQDKYQSDPSQYTIDNFSIYNDIISNLTSHCQKPDTHEDGGSRPTSSR